MKKTSDYKTYKSLDEFCRDYFGVGQILTEQKRWGSFSLGTFMLLELRAVIQNLK